MGLKPTFRRKKAYLFPKLREQVCQIYKIISIVTVIVAGVAVHNGNRPPDY